MMLVELTAVPQGAMPVDAFKDHLRLGSGFAEGDLQDTVLDGFLRAAMAAIEARTGKVLIERTFLWTLTRWHRSTQQPLPIAPVSAVGPIVMVDVDGNETTAPESWVLVPGSQRPILVPRATSLPDIPAHGQVRIEMLAGYGPDWSDLPADLAQACFLLAAHYYEYRMDSAAPQQNMPFGVSALIEPYRKVRLTMGGRA